jgi:Protein of unknown function (DUF1761)
MEINWLGVAIATVVQFVIGAVWYTFIFGKIWGKIHGFDKLPKETQDKMAGQMGPYYGGQLIITIFISIVLEMLINYLPNLSPYFIAFLMWIGFIVPTQYSDVIFGGTDGEYIVQKLAILGAVSLICVLVAAGILSFF